jgi:predicted XRE-type DNA-binding protein
MTSLIYDIGERPRTASRFISHVRSELQGALIKEKKKRKLTQQAIAKILGVNRSVINRQFVGTENLTLRSVAELAWALGYDVDFKLSKVEIDIGDNFGPAHTIDGSYAVSTKPNVPKIMTSSMDSNSTAKTYVANTVSLK